MLKKFDLDGCIRKVPDFPKPGVLFYDITGVITDPKAFSFCIDEMVEIYKDRNIDAVAAVEARGFLFAAPFAVRTGIPLILLRKKGKLPGKTLSRKYDLEYTSAELELHISDVKQGQRILLIDDLIATGGTLSAAKSLLIEGGGSVPEIFGVVGLPFLNYASVLKDTPVTTLITYDKE
ncbi:MAG: adenine phosphoribosyltransferase [Spirochaetaceae bacterium]|jgi:adenine phosphoribosyltransferase|nr:adenine phosphoribosyltransferase [Spirochaetaceae bacterium]